MIQKESKNKKKLSTKQGAESVARYGKIFIVAENGKEKFSINSPKGQNIFNQHLYIKDNINSLIKHWNIHNIIPEIVVCNDENYLLDDNIIKTMEELSQKLNCKLSYKLTDNIYFIVDMENIIKKYSIYIYLNKYIKKKNIVNIYEEAKNFKIALKHYYPDIYFKTSYKGNTKIPVNFAVKYFNEHLYIFLDNTFLYCEEKGKFSDLNSTNNTYLKSKSKKFKLIDLPMDEELVETRNILAKNKEYGTYLLGYVEAKFKEKNILDAKYVDVSKYLISSKSQENFYEIGNIFTIEKGKRFLTYDFSINLSSVNLDKKIILNEIDSIENNFIKGFHQNSKMIRLVKREIINPLNALYSLVDKIKY